MARMQDFAPNTPELLGTLSGPQTPCRKNQAASRLDREDPSLRKSWIRP